jgi:hypothetical protein
MVRLDLVTTEAEFIRRDKLEFDFDETRGFAETTIFEEGRTARTTGDVGVLEKVRRFTLKA